ncbi:MAG: hypothetical protein ACFFDF_14180 [Candidatus Odinarchaeota archaeon]
MVEIICKNCYTKFHEDLMICEKCGSNLPKPITKEMKESTVLPTVYIDTEYHDLLEEIKEEKRKQREAKKQEKLDKTNQKQLKKLQKEQKKYKKKQEKLEKKALKRKIKKEKKKAKLEKKREKREAKRQFRGFSPYDELPKILPQRLSEILHNLTLQILNRGCTGRIEVARCNGADLYLGALIVGIGNNNPDIDLAQENEIIEGIIIGHAFSNNMDLENDYENPFPDNQWVRIYCDPIGRAWCFINGKYRLVNLSYVIGKPYNEVVERFKDYIEIDHLALSLSENERCH